MRERTRGNAGRGYSREVWTQYHSRLAQLPNKGSREERHGKVVKLTELLRKREHNPDQMEITMDSSEMADEQEIQMDDRKEDKNEASPSGKVWPGQEEKSRENNQANEIPGKNSTPKSTRDNERTKSDHQVQSHTNMNENRMTTKNSNESEASSTDNMTETNPTKESDKMEIVTVWDYDETEDNKNGMKKSSVPTKQIGALES